MIQGTGSLVDPEFENHKQHVLKKLDLPEMWLTVMDQYNIVKQLGAGSFGIVVQAVCRYTN